MPCANEGGKGRATKEGQKHGTQYVRKPIPTSFVSEANVSVQWDHIGSNNNNLPVEVLCEGCKPGEVAGSSPERISHQVNRSRMVAFLQPKYEQIVPCIHNTSISHQSPVSSRHQSRKENNFDWVIICRMLALGGHER